MLQRRWPETDHADGLQSTRLGLLQCGGNEGHDASVKRITTLKNKQINILKMDNDKVVLEMKLSCSGFKIFIY